MQHFTERKHLIRWIMQNCRRRSVVRAMDEGSVELLGAFTDSLGPYDSSGWIVKVTSGDTGKVWYVEIVSNKGRYSIYLLVLDMPNGEHVKDLPWERWSGVDPDDTYLVENRNPLFDGDNPREYARKRNEQRKTKKV